MGGPSAASSVEGAMRTLLVRLVKLKLAALSPQHRALLQQLIDLRATSAPGVGSSPTVATYMLRRLLGEEEEEEEGGGSAVGAGAGAGRPPAFDPIKYCTTVISLTLAAAEAGDDAALTTPAGLLVLSSGGGMEQPPLAPVGSALALQGGGGGGGRGAPASPSEPCLLDQLSALADLSKDACASGLPRAPAFAQTALLVQIGALVTGAPLLFTGTSGLYGPAGVGFLLFSAPW